MTSLLFWYIRLLLAVGLHRLAYLHVNAWRKISPQTRRYKAGSVAIQYFQNYIWCKYCYWPMRTADEHLTERGGCYEDKEYEEEAEMLSKHDKCHMCYKNYLITEEEIYRQYCEQCAIRVEKEIREAEEEKRIESGYYD